MRRLAVIALVGALTAVGVGGCGGDSGDCPVSRGVARADRVPAGQTWLVGVRGDSRRSTVYAMTSSGLFSSRTLGGSWRKLGAGGQFLGFDMTRPEHLLGDGKRGLLVSMDAGNSWQRARLPSCVGPLEGAVFSRAGDLVYGWAGGPVVPDDPSEAAVLVSRDGGRRFEKVGPYDAESLTVADDPRVVYVTSAIGLFVSRSAGADWQRAAAPPRADPPAGRLHAISITPGTSKTLFVVADTGRFVESKEGEGGPTQRLYRSLDGGRHWTGVLEMFDITSVTTAPSDRATVYVAGEQIIDNHAGVVVRRSDDLGEHWQTRSFEPSHGGPTVADLDKTTSPNAATIVIDPANAQILYRDTGEHLQRSLDGGRSFTTLRVRPG